MNHCSMLEVRRFLFVIVRMSVGFGVEKSGGRLLCLFTPSPPTGASVIGLLFEEEKKDKLNLLHTEVIYLMLFR